MAQELGECRCCRAPVSRTRLACAPHWKMLPKALKDAILETYRQKAWRAYAVNVKQADVIWQEAGIWRPPVPMSARHKSVAAALDYMFAPIPTSEGE